MKREESSDQDLGLDEKGSESHEETSDSYNKD